MSILAMAIADQLAQDACGPVYGLHINRDTKKGHIARAAKSAAQMALIRHLGDVEPGAFNHRSVGFVERLAAARKVAADAFEAEVAYLKEHCA